MELCVRCGFAVCERGRGAPEVAPPKACCCLHWVGLGMLKLHCGEAALSAERRPHRLLSHAWAVGQRHEAPPAGGGGWDRRQRRDAGGDGHTRGGGRQRRELLPRKGCGVVGSEGFARQQPPLRAASWRTRRQPRPRQHRWQGDDLRGVQGHAGAAAMTGRHVDFGVAARALATPQRLFVLLLGLGQLRVEQDLSLPLLFGRLHLF
mmetsp:Transcript_19438/g.42527  ORF Transcript_19438/g.42527 Transcript_19438/m.42527 type:complete len:206 (-) Transcript_19438:1114-1731(-)